MRNPSRLRPFIIAVILLTVAISSIMMFIDADTDSDVDSSITGHAETVKNYVVYPVKIPENLQFAGEHVPLEWFDVTENLDRELLINVYWQSHTMLLIKRANRYFPVMEPILKKYGIPADLIYIPVAESDLTNAVSPAQAVGFWQFMKSTAIEYGLEVNDEVDERYHIEKSTEAACKFLIKSFELYGNWTMAAASYNIGRNGLNTQVDRQKTDNYYDLLLNDETSRYVYRLLALKLILTNPEEYGFIAKPEDLYVPVPVYEVTVDGPVMDFTDFAARYSINYKILKIFNPWLRDNTLTNKNNTTYYLKIPKSDSREF